MRIFGAVFGFGPAAWPLTFYFLSTNQYTQMGFRCCFLVYVSLIICVWFTYLSKNETFLRHVLHQSRELFRYLCKNTVL